MYEKEDPEQYAELKKVWNNYQSECAISTGGNVTGFPYEKMFGLWMDL